MKDTLKQLADLHDENIELKKEIERLKAEREWISVEDRLPEFGEEYNCVQVLDDVGNPVTSITEYYAIEKIFCYPGTDIEQKGITHWMPLPEPPKQ